MWGEVLENSIRKLWRGLSGSVHWIVPDKFSADQEPKGGFLQGAANYEAAVYLKGKSWGYKKGKSGTGGGENHGSEDH